MSLPRLFLELQPTDTASVCTLPMLLIMRPLAAQKNLLSSLLPTRPTHLRAPTILHQAQFRVRNFLTTMSWLLLNENKLLVPDQCNQTSTVPSGVFPFTTLIEQKYLNADGTNAPGIDFRYDTCSQTVRVRRISAYY